MKKCFLTISALFIFLISCNKDDVDNGNRLSDFIVIGEEEGAFYELVFNASTNQTVLTNLSDELDISVNNLQEITFTGDIISFYHRNAGSFSASQKDLNTGISKKYNSYFTNTANQIAIWNCHSPKHIFVGYESPVGSGDVYLRIIDRQDESFKDLFLTSKNRATLEGRPMYQSGKLIISFVEEGIYKTFLFNTQSQLIDTTVIYEGAPNILRNTNGTLSVFDNTGTYFEYDLLSLTKTGTRTMSKMPAFLRFGNLEDSFVNNDIVYHKSPAAQPSYLIFYPGIFDINSQKNSIIDVNENTQITFEPLQGTRFIPLAIMYDTVNEIFLVGFKSDYEDGTKGVMLFDKNKKLMNAVELPFSPFKIILKN